MPSESVSIDVVGLNPIQSDMLDTHTERRKKEMIRLMLQSLQDMGLSETVSTLERESGVKLQDKDVISLCEDISNGNWDSVQTMLRQVKFIKECDYEEALRLVYVQMFFEQLEKRDISNALLILRNNLAKTSSIDDLQRLSRLILCSSAEDLRREGRWDVTSSSSRDQLLHMIKSLLSPQVYVPQSRLDTLVDQALRHQKDHCIYHNSLDHHYSLFHDHLCQIEELPSRCVAVLEAHSDEVWFVRFSHNGLYLASASKDNSVIIWDLSCLHLSQGAKKNRKQLSGHLGGVTCISWSKDDSKILTSSLDHVIRLWNVQDGTCLKTMSKHTESVTSCAWFPDCRHFISGSDDKMVYLWNVDTGRVVREWEETTKINGVGVTSDGGKMVLICAGKKIHIYHHPLSSQWDSVDTPDHFTLEDQHPVVSMDLSKNGRYVTVFTLPSTDIHIWDLEEKKIVKCLQKRHIENRMVIFPCFGGPDENFIASGSEDSQIYIWHRDTERLLTTLEGHSGTVNAVSWTCQAGSLLASCSDDRTVRIWAGKGSPFYK